MKKKWKSGNRNRKRGGKRKNGRGKRLFLWAAATFALVLLAGGAVLGFLFFNKERGWKKPPELLTEYMAYVLDGEYEKMYGILDAETSGNVSLEDFIERNEAIYKGIEIRSLGISAVEYDEERMAVKYHSSCETAAGNISFDNEACFIKGEEGYWLSWNDGLIFPGLEKGDKVRVSTEQAERGSIYDRNGVLLAGKGVASSVGI